MRIHCIGLPHTQTHRDFTACAFTQKVHKFLQMFSGHNHEIFHYGHERIDWEYPDVTHVPVITDRDHCQAYGNEYVYQQAWRTHGFAHYYSINDHAHTTFSANTIKELKRNKKPLDIVLHFWGLGTKSIADALPDMVHIEPGIGNGSGWARWRVYESYTLRAACEGIDAVNSCKQDWYHTVINNYFDPNDFTYNPNKSEYSLFLGRVGYSKGVDIAIEATQHTGQTLVIAGQGSLSDMGYTTVPKHVEFVGYADSDTRRQLLANASSLFIASRYSEPFGGVMAEAWLSGTPVISPDWGAFGEFNIQNVTGYRCRTLQHFVTALNDTRVGAIDSADCLVHGLKFSLDAIRPEYESYFNDVLDIYRARGWYELN